MADSALNAHMARQRLRSLGSPEHASILARFFKTGPGQYGEGDRFIGIKVPVIRKVAKELGHMPLPEVERLLHSEIHEERLLALIILVARFEKGDETTKRTVYQLYFANLQWINNWDLVDLSSPQIVGGYLATRSRKPLQRLAKSSMLWKRRIAIVSTHAFIRQDDFADTLAIAEMLLADKHDLIHKAVGWMLREVGKRNTATLEEFLRQYGPVMPRTTLRYAIERFPEKKRLAYLNADSRSPHASARRHKSGDRSSR